MCEGFLYGPVRVNIFARYACFRPVELYCQSWQRPILVAVTGIFSYFMALFLHNFIGGPTWLWLGIFIICMIYMVMDAFMGNKYDV